MQVKTALYDIVDHKFDDTFIMGYVTFVEILGSNINWQKTNKGISIIVKHKDVTSY